MRRSTLLGLGLLALAGASCAGSTATGPGASTAGRVRRASSSASLAHRQEVGTDFLAAPPPPDLISRDTADSGLRLLGARHHNEGADSVPVTVQLAVQDVQLIGAELEAFLTYAGAPVSGAETSVKVGPGAQNSVLSLLVPRPNDVEPRREYELHVRARYVTRDGNANPPIESEHVSQITAADPVVFGEPVSACAPVLHPRAQDHAHQRCPIRFSAKTSALGDHKNERFSAANTNEINRVKEVIAGLCREQRLLVVTVSGWSSVTFSDAPTNEQLARRRAESIRQVLADGLRGDRACEVPQPGGDLEAVLFVDPRAGRATASFGENPQDNQCVQLSVHHCE